VTKQRNALRDDRPLTIVFCQAELRHLRSWHSSLSGLYKKRYTKTRSLYWVHLRDISQNIDRIYAASLTKMNSVINYMKYGMVWLIQSHYPIQTHPRHWRSGDLIRPVLVGLSRISMYEEKMTNQYPSLPGQWAPWYIELKRRKPLDGEIIDIFRWRDNRHIEIYLLVG
jgi:hypothetical protein